MKNITCDVAVIGAGPAGLAAALGAKEAGAEKVVIIERDRYLGGILQQCIHSGFGLHTFGEDLSGPEYAERFITRIREQNITVMTGAMVLHLDSGLRIIAAKADAGLIGITSKAIVLAMGCRERTRGAIALPGQRPAGIYTAGAAQRFINIEGFLPGKKIVILGSGDIGMIMARRFRLEGAQVKAVVEIMPCIGGLNRNLVQCLNDFDIPLFLNHTVTNIMGKKRVEKVTVAPFYAGEADLTAQFDIDCDTLLLSVGLIPENELSKQAAVELDPTTGGPVVDQNFHTSQPGIFAAGNVVMVFDLVDHVSTCGEQAGKAAALYAANRLKHWRGHSARVASGKGVRCVMPQRVNVDSIRSDIHFFLRADIVMRKAKMQMQSIDQTGIFAKNFRIARPPEMLSAVTEAVNYQAGRQYFVNLEGEL